MSGGAKTTGEKFNRLVEIMATLRGPNGCPWDKQQDFNSLKPMLVEEVYEVLEAIENSDFDGMAEELGDLLLHVRAAVTRSRDTLFRELFFLRIGVPGTK